MASTLPNQAAKSGTTTIKLWQNVGQSTEALIVLVQDSMLQSTHVKHHICRGTYSMCAGFDATKHTCYAANLLGVHLLGFYKLAPNNQSLCKYINWDL